MLTPRIEVCSPSESVKIIAWMKLTEREVREQAVEAARHGGFDFALHGYVDIYFRDAKSGEVEDEVHQANLITDLGRRLFNTGIGGAAFSSSIGIGTSPSVEPALIGRYNLNDTGAASSSQISTAIAPTFDGATLTRSWLFAFGVPPATRRIGTVGLSNRLGAAWSNQRGLSGLAAYTVISPAKTQAVTQTLEVNYRITLTPTA